jgi:hypothetical protein
MPIPLIFKRKRSRAEVKVLSFQHERDVDWIAWWYCGLQKNPRAESQPLVLVGFRRLIGNEMSDEVIKRQVALDQLGQMRIGTIWRNGKSEESVIFTTEIFNVNFTRNKWSFTSFKTANPDNPPFPQERYPRDPEYPHDRSWLVQFPCSENRRLVIPCLEFFSRCYGRSGELKRTLATYPWEDPYHPRNSRLYSPIDIPEEDGKWQVKLRRKMFDGDVIFLAHAKYNPFTTIVAKSIYAQLESQYAAKYPLNFIKVGPWFEGLAQLKVNGIWSSDRKTFLALQIVGCSDPGGIPILRDRDNPTNTGPCDDETKKGESWKGAPRRIKPPEIIDLTSDSEPDHNASNVAIKDPDFEVLGIQRKVIDIKRSRTESTSGKPGDTPTPDAFSGGEAYGDGKSVGYASISAPSVMESLGMLRDMWNAALSFKASHPDRLSSVEYFTFNNGFSDDDVPDLIPLKPFHEHDNNIDKDVRKWVYLTREYPRGILVMRLKTKDKTVYIIEIQRRTIFSFNGPENIEEQSFQGFIFALNDESVFENLLHHFLSRIRYYKGVSRHLLHDWPSSADTFNHSHSRKQPERFPCEFSVLNALGKMNVYI